MIISAWLLDQVANLYGKKSNVNRKDWITVNSSTGEYDLSKLKGFPSIPHKWKINMDQSLNSSQRRHVLQFCFICKYLNTLFKSIMVWFVDWCNWELHITYFSDELKPQ